MGGGMDEPSIAKQLVDAIMSNLQLPTSELVRGVGGVAEGIPLKLRATCETTSDWHVDGRQSVAHVFGLRPRQPA